MNMRQRLLLGPPPSALESALRESFLEIDHEMRAKVDLPEAQLEQTGCTAVAAVRDACPQVH